MRAGFLTIAALSAGLMMSSSAVFAAAPQPQYSVQDVAKTFGQAPASDAKGDQAPGASATPGGVCESKGKVTGPGGKEYTVHPVQVNEGRMLLLPEGFTLPFTLVHSDLGWRVKVDGLIAARQAAEKEEKKSTAPVER